MLKRLLKQEHLFTPEKLREMKVQLKELENELSNLEKQTSKGFGKYETSKSKRPS
jgi:predicted nuclease with TOPRIM domain